MTELGPNLAGSPSRAGHRASYPPGDTRPAPHSGSPGLRRTAPLRPPHAPAQSSSPAPRERGCHAFSSKPLSRTAGERGPSLPLPPPRAGEGQGGGLVGEGHAALQQAAIIFSGMKWALASNKIRHPDEAATAAVSNSLPLAKAGDAPAPLPPQIPLSAPWGGEGRGEVGASPSPEQPPLPVPYATTAAPTPYRRVAEHRPGITPHPEN
jgi:hypothetical protein